MSYTILGILNVLKHMFANTIVTAIYFTNHIALLVQIPHCSNIGALNICSINEKKKIKAVLESLENHC